MLYEHWRNLAAERHTELALRDAASGCRWTFAELFAAGETRIIGQAGTVFPQSHSPEFIFDLLAAWRENRIVCPLEVGQSPPEILPPPKNCVHLKSTSATGGTAQLVAFTAGQLMADAENIVATMGLRSDWPNLGVISLAHSYGFSNLILPLLLHGIPLILAPAPLPEIIRRAAAGEPALTLAAVPAMWRAWHEAEAIPSNVRLAISAGAPLSVELEQAVFAARGLKLHNFYGSTECGGIAYDATEKPRTDATCVGSPMKNVSLSVAEDGCLEVRSRAVAETYWPRPDANLGGGCFHTSDLAEISDGLVCLRGRAGDQINVAGRKVSPETIERVLLQHPRVWGCVVFGVPSRDAERTEEIVAVVVSREGEGALREFVLKSLPAWQTPRRWWFVEAVRANARGKVSRTEWRAKFLRTRDKAV
ncbi:MAG: long-chain fatty acid--CoA ligase [Verrucomicrobia bacterium]|nr:MAG: long-chain fatty acid--CoA ligase [Verrucomicrobiota bacterium]